MGPEIPIPDWLVDLWRYHKRKADQAKATVDRLEREIADIQKEIDETETEIEREEERRAREGWKFGFG